MSASGHHLARLGGLVVAIALSSLLVLAGVTGSHRNVEAGSGLIYLTPEQALSEPRALLDRAVSVHGRVAHVFSSQAFALQSGLVRQGLLIVLSERGLEGEEQVTVGQDVEVVGTLHMLSRQEANALMQKLGSQLPLRSSSYGYREHPYLLAQGVHRAPAT